MQQLRGRFAPSPSGEMHLGNVWTALLAWLAVRHVGGVMILRMEDLDTERSRSEYARQIMLELKWLGLDWDEGPDIGGEYGSYNQDDRRYLYENAIEKLVQKGLVYPCYCSRAELHSPTLAPHAGQTEWRYPGFCRALTKQECGQRQGRRPLLRVATPDRNYSFDDLIQGSYTENLAQSCGDFIVRRSDGVHAYQLAVVVDDGLMNISQVVRGADLLTSTPRQLFLYESLELRPPVFAHAPLLVDPDGKRLSKRQQSLSLAALRKQGVQPEVINGFLAAQAGLIDTYEPVAAKDLIDVFSFQKIPRDSVVIDKMPDF